MAARLLGCRQLLSEATARSSLAPLASLREVLLPSARVCNPCNGLFAVTSCTLRADTLRQRTAVLNSSHAVSPGCSHAALLPSVLWAGPTAAAASFCHQAAQLQGPLRMGCYLAAGDWGPPYRSPCTAAQACCISHHSQQPGSQPCKLMLFSPQLHCVQLSSPSCSSWWALTKLVMHKLFTFLLSVMPTNLEQIQTSTCTSTTKGFTHVVQGPVNCPHTAIAQAHDELA